MAISINLIYLKSILKLHIFSSSNQKFTDATSTPTKNNNSTYIYILHRDLLRDRHYYYALMHASYSINQVYGLAGRITNTSHTVLYRYQDRKRYFMSSSFHSLQAMLFKAIYMNTQWKLLCAKDRHNMVQIFYTPNIKFDIKFKIQGSGFKAQSPSLTVKFYDSVKILSQWKLQVAL